MTIRAKIDAQVGYVICGLLILAASEAASDGKWLFESGLQPERIALFGTLAWCAGYLVSRYSCDLLEQKFVHGFLKSPVETLLDDRGHRDRSWKETLFSNWHCPLPEETRDRILRAAEQECLSDFDRTLFPHAWTVVKHEPAILRRLELHRQLSSICRALCVGFVVVSTILVCGIIWHGVYSGWGQSDLRKLGYCLLSLFEAAAMLYRYLKFHRQYVAGVLIGYAEISSEPVQITPNAGHGPAASLRQNRPAYAGRSPGLERQSAIH